MQNISTFSYLTVDIDNGILDLVYILNLPIYDINLHHDHLYISADSKGNLEGIFSYESKTPNDIRVAVETFSEILIDIASGMKVKQAFERQGYTY